MCECLLRVGILVCFHRFPTTAERGRVCPRFCVVGERMAVAQIKNQMKRFLQFLVASALVVSMQGCSKDSALEPNPDSKVQLRLTGEINQTTRVNDAGFQTNDAVGVYVSTNGTLAESGNYFDNEKYTYANDNGSGELTSTIPIYWPTKDSELSVFAYYPYVESVSSTSAYPFAVATDQNADGAFYQSDFLYANALNLAPTSEPVALAFEHKLSRVDIELGVAAESSITLDQLKAAEKNLTIIGVAAEGTIDLEDGTATAGDATTTITPMANDGGVSYSAVVYPQTNKVTFRIELNDRVYGYSTNATFEAGKKYTYTLTINAWDQPQLTPSGVSVTDWTAGENSTGTMSDFIDIPDPVFKAYLLQEKLYTDPYDGDENPTKMIDQNRDGQISIEEAEAVVRINISTGETDEEINAIPEGQKVKSLQGIEYFTNLEYLDCRGNLLETLDVSHNTKLRSLSCMTNKLTALDVSKNTLLDHLYFGSFSENSNQITEIDLSNNPNLLTFGCETNALTELDFTNNPKLASACISHNKKLNGNVNFSNNAKMEVIYAYQCGLTSVNSETFNIANMPELKELYVGGGDGDAGNKIASIDLSNNTKLERLDIGHNELKGVDLSQNSKLKYLNIRECGITSLSGLTHLTDLEDLDCSINDFSGEDVVDFSTFTKLWKLFIDDAEVKAIDVSNNTLLKELGFDTNSDITEVDLSANTALKVLRCFRCSIVTLDLSTNTALKELYCDPMQTLTTIYIPSAGYTFEKSDIPDGVTLTVKPAN